MREAARHGTVPSQPALTRDVSFVEAAPRRALLLALVSVAGALPFIGALGGPFLWDDTHLIENNPRVHTLTRVSELFTHSYFDTGTGTASHFLAYYRPISALSYAIDWVLGKGNPALFHATNVLLAMIVTWLAADCLLRWTGSSLSALWCALIFAWHPSKAESVAWISGRTDLLAAGFMLLACKAHSKRISRSRAWVAVELLSTLCAYASKETALLLPILIAIEHASTPQQATLEGRGLLSLMWKTRLHWIGALGYLAARSAMLPVVSWTHPPVTAPALLNRCGLAFETLGHAAHLLLFPYPQSAEHGLTTFDDRGRIVLHGPHVILGIVFVFVVAGCFWLTRRRLPAFALGSAMIPLTLLPVANLIPTQLQCAFYERFLFLPTLGLALLFATVLRRALPHTYARLACLPIFAGILVSYATRCVARSSDYADAVRFWNHEATVNPTSTIAPRALADSAAASGRMDIAIEHLNQCHTNAVRRRQDRTALRCAYDGAMFVADSTPDLDRATLTSAERFFAALADPSTHGYAQFEGFHATLTIDTSASSVKQLIDELSGESLAVLSSIELRLARPQALEHARRAANHCRTCLYALRAARVIAATGHIDEALSIADGPQQNGGLSSATQVQAQLRQYALWTARAATTRGPEQIHALAQGYLSLGLYGAAYALLESHAQEFRAVPAMRLQYAQVAYYAGDTTTARNTLLATLSGESAEALLATWGKSSPNAAQNVQHSALYVP